VFCGDVTADEAPVVGRSLSSITNNIRLQCVTVDHQGVSIIEGTACLLLLVCLGVIGAMKCQERGEQLAICSGVGVDAWFNMGMTAAVS